MSKRQVCVSGVTGYVASHVVKELLAHGYLVHGTVRNIADTSRFAHITSLPNANTNFRAFQADLLTPGSFDAALDGCMFAVHCASPYILDGGRDPQQLLVDPAVTGTLSFLESCKKVGTVRKVVLTSSVAAVADEGGHGTVFDETVWNEKSNLTRLPYYYSKRAAEKAAWDWAAQTPQVKLVTILPFLVIGPSMSRALNPSPEILIRVIEGKTFPGVVDLTFTFVDVRDVAHAHVAALETEHASGRYICANSDRPVHMRELVSVLSNAGYTPNTLSLTNPILTKLIRWSTYVTSPNGYVSQYTRNHLGNPIMVSNEKIKKELGIVFRDPKQSIEETLADLVNWGHLPSVAAAITENQ